MGGEKGRRQKTLHITELVRFNDGRNEEDGGDRTRPQRGPNSRGTREIMVPGIEREIRFIQKLWLALAGLYRE